MSRAEALDRHAEVAAPTRQDMAGNLRGGHACVRTRVDEEGVDGEPCVARFDERGDALWAIRGGGNDDQVEEGWASRASLRKAMWASRPFRKVGISP